MRTKYASKTSHYLVAVDPGKRKAGLCVGFVCLDGRGVESTRTLLSTTVKIKSSKPEAMVSAIMREVARFVPMRENAVLVVEAMKRYPAKQARDADLEVLETMSKLLSTKFTRTYPKSRSYKYTPQQWKGSIRKGPHHRRLKMHFESEHPVVPFDSTQHDALDAFGLWAFAAGLVKRGGILAKKER